MHPSRGVIAVDDFPIDRHPCHAKLSMPYADTWHSEKLEQLYTLLTQQTKPLNAKELQDRLESSSQWLTERSKKPGCDKPAMLRTAHLHLEMSMNVPMLLKELISAGAAAERNIV